MLLLYRLVIRKDLVISFVVVQTYSLLQISLRKEAVKCQAESGYIVVKT